MGNRKKEQEFCDKFTNRNEDQESEEAVTSLGAAFYAR
jgi:hypothetical protein